jgi:ABC-2 type transport system ATP-binding protein
VLIYQAGYYGLRPRDVGERADSLLERFELSAWSREPFTKLSGGMKRRLSLARALIHSPRLLILDEPTAGVDIELRLELWDLLRELNAAGTTIFLTTHYLEEAEALCRHIGIIEGGRLLALEPTPRLLERHGRGTLVVHVEGAIDALPREIAARASVEDHVVRIEGVDPSEVGVLLEDVSRSGLRVGSVDYGRSSLQDIFLELTRR